MKVSNKVVVVTGGGAGMGRELVLGLLARGARVAAVDIKAEGLAETAALAAAGDRLAVFVANIADRDAVERLAGAVTGRFGSVDIVINCAGIIQPFVRLNDLGYDAVERVMNVNFYGTLYMVKTFLPLLLAREEAQIVNISSMGGYLPVPGQTIYGASKAAVKLMTEGLRTELADTKVHVTVVFPGAVGTNIAGNSGVKIDTSAAKESSIPMLAPAEAARIMLEGIERNADRVFVGKDARAMDLLYRLNPKKAADFICSKMRELLPR